MKPQIKQSLPIGISDFRELREKNCYFIDKSDFIREIIDAAAKVILLPRPRRFGKTLNLSMLKVFFEKDTTGAKELFNGLSIEKSDCFEIHQGKYPVIWITMKDIKEGSWDACFRRITTLIQTEFERHEYLVSWNDLKIRERAFVESILKNTAEPPDYSDSLTILSKCLHRYHGKPVIILIDEYDTPLHAAYDKGYYEEISGFMRNFLSGGLKDNPHLFKGVITGILRVAKESIFSGLNNLGVYTLLVPEFNQFFGFTDTEIKQMLESYDVSDRYHDVAFWYNGYLFGGKTVYNPWSVINFINSEDKIVRPYWLNTADTSIINQLATRGGRELKDELGQLLEKGMIQRPIYENIVMRDLDSRSDLIWSFLLFSGYLKTMGEPVHRNLFNLSIPNNEVRIIYEEMIVRWFSEKIETNHLMEMLNALENGNVPMFERMLCMIVKQVMSYHDLGSEPEKVYHALVLGMLVWMSGKYEIRSNRESGFGRYDVMLKPKNQDDLGIVIEFKKVDARGENAHEPVLKEALEQIEKRKYTADLEAAGVKRILKLAVAFRGKKLWIAEDETFKR